MKKVITKVRPLTAAEKAELLQHMSKRAIELSTQLASREDIEVGPFPDLIDAVSNYGDVKKNIIIKETRSKLADEIRQALKRFDDPDFGICIECELPISNRRLICTDGTAIRCTRCQEAHDRQEREGILSEPTETRIPLLFTQSA